MPNNQFGDFQTPISLARSCLDLLKIPSDALILEPTCGRGAFLEAASELAPDSECYGIEINATYAMEASQWGTVTQGNVFEISLSEVLPNEKKAPIYIIGNPPWVTSAELKRMSSDNIPPKENFKKVQGIDALLGGSNFDVCEFIILKALREFNARKLHLAMLCKTQVARNVIRFAYEAGLPIVKSSLFRIDAKEWFNANVDACWFVVEMNPEKTPSYETEIYDSLTRRADEPAEKFGIVKGKIVSDVAKYNKVKDADGKSPYEWRSGLKHDAAGVFELTLANDSYSNKRGEPVDVEREYVYPYLKSTDIYRGRHRASDKAVIVPQKEFGQDTLHLKQSAPKLWNYLDTHASDLDSRKSSIYKNRPRFSVFGLGSYTFAPYKIAISGLHKVPTFRLITPKDGKPVVLDDTCYLLAFDDSTEAIMVASVLNSAECLALIDSLIFTDAKRPITKKLLDRIDLNKLPLSTQNVIETAKQIAIEYSLDFDEESARSMIGNFGFCKKNEQLFLV